MQRGPAHLQSQGRERKVSALTTQLRQSPGTAAGESRLVHPVKSRSVNTADSEEQPGTAGLRSEGGKSSKHPLPPTLGTGRLPPEKSHCPSKGLFPASDRCQHLPEPSCRAVEFPFAFCFASAVLNISHPQRCPDSPGILSPER